MIIELDWREVVDRFAELETGIFISDAYKHSANNITTLTNQALTQRLIIHFGRFFKYTFSCGCKYLICSYLQQSFTGRRKACSALLLIAFDVGRTLPNTDLSRDFMGLVMDGSMDLGTHIWHSPQIFFQGRMTSQRRESLGSRSSNALPNL